MKFTKINAKTLSLADNEIAVLNALKQIPSALVTALAEQTGIPRTTVGFILQNLKKRGFVARNKINNHFEWQLVDDNTLAFNFRKLINNLDYYSETIGLIEDKSLVIEVFRGKEKIIESVKKILKFNTAERVYYIQCASSAKYQTKEFAKEFTFDFHQKIKKSKIIMEAIVGEEVLPYFKKLSKQELESHLGRPIITYVVPDEHIDFDADIIMHQDTTIILNYQEESVVIIKNKLFTNIFMSLFELIKENAKKIDINQYIKDIIETK